MVGVQLQYHPHPRTRTHHSRIAAFFRKLVGIVQEVGENLCLSHGINIHLHIFGREILEELQRRPDKQAMRLIDVIEQPAHALPLKGEREVTRLDARQFQHIANKFTKEGSIRLGYCCPSGMSEVHLYVEDTGIGIPHSERR